MCLAVPARIIKLLEDGRAVVSIGNVHHEISLALVEGAKVDDYVLVHVGFALSRVDPKEAEKTLALFDEFYQSQERQQA